MKIIIKNSNQKVKTFLLSIALFPIWGLGGLFAQPTIQWQRSLGGTLEDQVNIYGAESHREHLALTSDGGVIFATASFSNDGDVSGHHGSSLYADCWLVKVDSLGYIDWQLSLGGSADDEATSVIQTADGGYIMTALSASDDGDVGAHHGPLGTSGNDIWIVKLDAAGGILWDYIYGGSADDYAGSIKQTADGGYIFVGGTSSLDFDVTSPIVPGAITGDVWLVKLDAAGIIQWQKSLGGSKVDNGLNINLTTDGGFILTGTTISSDFDVTYNNDTTIANVWIVKTDALGNIQMQTTKGGSMPEVDAITYQTYDGGYICGVNTWSGDGDVTNPTGGLPPDPSYWVMKLDSTFNVQWDFCYGGTSIDNFRGLSLTGNPNMPGADGCVLIGWTISTDGMVTTSLGGFGDIWAIKIDENGVLEWQKSYGGSGQDRATGIFPTAYGGYYFIGETMSNDVDVSGHHGSAATNDIWLVKLNPVTTGITENNNSTAQINVFPNPLSTATSISLYLNKSEYVSIKIYDITGSEIKNLYSGVMSAGEQNIEWAVDQHIHSGIYIVKIQGTDYSLTKKLNVIR